MALARRNARIDLLLTDVLMPQLGGPQLVERHLATYPAPSISYMTGYINEETMQLELDPEVMLLRQPFNARDLARAVRSALDLRREPVGAASVWRLATQMTRGVHCGAVAHADVEALLPCCTEV